jgi:hypothetical protein
VLQKFLHDKEFCEQVLCGEGGDSASEYQGDACSYLSVPGEQLEFRAAQGFAAEVPEDRGLAGVFADGLLEGAGDGGEMLEELGDLGSYHRK